MAWRGFSSVMEYMGDLAIEEPVAVFWWSQRFFSKTHAGMIFSQNRRMQFPNFLLAAGFCQHRNFL